jgi:predicted  nucleic acid-binding Zn-ribbon protein
MAYQNAHITSQAAAAEAIARHEEPSDLDRAYRLCDRLRKALTEMREELSKLLQENAALRLRNDDLERREARGG